MMLRQARYLTIVADQGSFTKAAAALNVSQPALSQQIRLLEESLGVQLLDRSGRTVKATEAGKAYIEHVRRAMRELDAARRAVTDVENLDRGTLRLGFLPLFSTYLAGPLVQAFHRRHPGIDVSVDILAQGAMETALSEDRLDLGLAFGETSREGMASAPLCDERLCLIVGFDHAAHSRGSIAATELGTVNLALLNHSFITRGPIDGYLRDNGVHPRVAVESNSVDSLLAIIRGGRLATIMPEASARGVPGLKAIPLKPPFKPYVTSLIRWKESYPSAASRAFELMVKAWPWAQGVVEPARKSSAQHAAPIALQRSSRPPA